MYILFYAVSSSLVCLYLCVLTNYVSLTLSSSRAAAEQQLRRLAEEEAQERLARVRAEEAAAREEALRTERDRAAQDM